MNIVTDAAELVVASKEAGIKVPTLEGDETLADLLVKVRDDYPHFYLFAVMQVGHPVPNPYSVLNNAKIIAAISEEDIRTIKNRQQLIEKGFE